MKKYYSLSVLICYFSSIACVQSASEGGHWYIGESIGGTFHAVANNSYVDTGDNWPADRYHNNHTNGEFTFSVSGGYQWLKETVWFPAYSLGARYVYTRPASTHGTVFQFNLPQFDNYRYQYKIQRQNLLGVGKINLYRYHQVMPYLTAGLGLSGNRLTRFVEYPRQGIEPRTMPGFQNKTLHQFSYILGAGVDYVITHRLWTGVEYNFGNYGHAKTGQGMVGFSGTHLKSKLMDNSIAVTLNYFFDTAA